jgi:hypothetical protein
MKKIHVFAALLLLVFSAYPSQATDWNFYGSARIMTWYESGDAPGFLNEHDNGDLNQNDSELTWALQTNSRIGAKIKHGDIEARFEFGTDVDLRRLYAIWKFAKGQELLIGQDYAPLGDIGYSNQVYAEDEGLSDAGTVDDGRRPMIQWSWNGLKVALISVQDGFVPDGYLDDADIDVVLPKIEAHYRYEADMFYAGVFGGYQTYQVDAESIELEPGTVRPGGIDVNAYVAGAEAGVTLGPVYVNAQVYWAQNAGAFGLAAAGFNQPVYVNNSLQDATTLGFGGVIGWAVNDMLSFEAGAGYTEEDNDAIGKAEGYTEKDKTAAYYLQATITLAQGVFIVPEVGYWDLYDDIAGNDEKDFWYAGAKWQINF